MLNYYYSDSFTNFQNKSLETIVGEISRNSRTGHIITELIAWETQIILLKTVLKNKEGHLFFEFSIPRMGRRVDCLMIFKNIIFVVEFKVGESRYLRADIEQVWDYALDLKNFHFPSHKLLLAPILVATSAKRLEIFLNESERHENLLDPINSNSQNLGFVIDTIAAKYQSNNFIDPKEYLEGSYSPTPTIIEAAISLYNSHNVDEITRNDAEAANLLSTTRYISETISYAKNNHKKIICFVTGVPGAGKTLVGLRVATEHLDKEQGNTSVFLSGNKPLVDVLQEALTRDKVAKEKLNGTRITKKQAKESVKAFIQIIHHYRDEYLRDPKAPYDHVAIFDEAQRAWTKEQTVKFMRQKKGISSFSHSEPEFLISCLDRHQDWAVIVCLVGGGQEINTGEAGISEWLSAIKGKFNNWETRVSSRLSDTEYAAETMIADLQKWNRVLINDSLHLSVSMRSFRAEKLSLLVKQILDLNGEAKITLDHLSNNYPIVLTRDVSVAKNWLKRQAKGSERYGIVVSSQAYRLKPLAMDVRSPINHVTWFLNDKDDIRSSYFLEDVATEFQVQGLELDWVCVAWDGDLRFSRNGWQTFSFVGNKWQNIKQEVRRKFLINAYRVLLTRARQGMVIVIPKGETDDHTRKPEYYNATYNYLLSIGFPTIE